MLNNGFLIFDGAMGTSLQKYGLAAGELPELLNFSNPDMIEKIHRDTYHASLGLGRYALGLLWYRTLTGNSVTGNDFHHFDVPIPEEHIQIAKKCVDSL